MNQPEEFLATTKQTEAENAPLESDERLRLFIAASSSLMYRMNADWSRMENLVGREMLADTAEPVTDWADRYLLPEDHEHILAMIRNAIENKSVYELEHRVIRANGTIGWVHSRALPMLNAQGEITEWFGTATEITEHRRMEGALAQSEEKYRTIFETIDEGFCVYEIIYDESGKPADLRRMEVNPAYEKQTGLKDTVGKLASEVMPGTENYWLEIYDNVVKTGIAAHFEHWHEPTGRWYYTFSSRIGSADNKQVAVLFSDITERKQLEEQQKFLLKLSDELRPQADPVGIQETACRLLGDIIQANRCYYCEIDEVNQIVIIHREYQRTNTPKLNGIHPMAPFKPLLELGLSGNAVAVDDIFSHMVVSENAEAYSERYARAFVLAPLIKNGEMVAAMVMTMEHARQWKQYEVDLIQEVADRTWASVERAKAEAALRESEAKLTQDLFDAKQLQQISSKLIEQNKIELLYASILDVAMAIMHSDAGSMQLFVPEKNELQLLAWKNFSPPAVAFWQTVTPNSATTCGNSMQTLERTIVSDVEKSERMAGSEDLVQFRLAGVKAVQSTPLISRTGNLLGMISTHWTNEREPSEHELNLFDVIARQAADLIERKLSDDVIQSTLTDTQLLRELGERLISEVNIETLYRQILEVAIKLTNADAGSVQIYNEATRELLLLATKGFEKDMTDHFYSVDASSQTSCGRALAANERVFSNYDVPPEEDIDGSMQMHVKAGYVYAQSTPLISRSDKPIGMLSTHWHKRYHPTEHQLRFIDLLARQAADLIERKQAEEALRQSEEKYHTLFDSIDQGWMIAEVLFDGNDTATDYIVLETNAAFYQHTGLPPDVIGKKISEIVPGGPVPWLDIYGKAVLTGTPERFEYEIKHGPLTGWYDIYILPFHERSKNCVGVVFTDITERKHRERRQEFLLKLADILRTIADPVVLRNAAMKLLGEQLDVTGATYFDVDANQETFCLTAAYEKEQVFIPSQMRFSDFAEDLADNYRSGKTMFVCDTEDEVQQESQKEAYRAIVVRAWAAVPLVKSGQLVAIVGVHSKTARNWTEEELKLLEDFAEKTWTAMERANAEEALRSSEFQLKQLLRMRDEFIGIASHELKTPVTSMKAYAEIVKKRLTDIGDIEDTDLVSKLNTQIDRLTMLINSLLDTTKISEGQLQLRPEQLDITELITDRIDEIKRTSNHKFELKLPDLPPLLADRERIGQVITNLLSNAIKYSPKGTTIVVSGITDHECIKVSVADQGFGIPEQDIAKIFDRFFRVRANNMDTFPGMGLGLYITAQIIQKHGGAIEVKSAAGKGSVFTFTLPYGR